MTAIAVRPEFPGITGWRYDGEHNFRGLTIMGFHKLVKYITKPKECMVFQAIRVKCHSFAVFSGNFFMA